MEDRALATSDFDVKFWKRYVDDTCVALAASKCKTFLGHMNMVEPTIQFTLEQDGNCPSRIYSWSTIQMSIQKNNPCGQAFGFFVHITPWLSSWQLSVHCSIGLRCSHQCRRLLRRKSPYNKCTVKKCLSQMACLPVLKYTEESCGKT